MRVLGLGAYRKTIDEICDLNWQGLGRDELIGVASAYHHFSIQFRENLAIARQLYPDDEKLRQLEAEECGTGNLSPWPGVAEPGERLNHDEFVRRLLLLSPLDSKERARLATVGRSYLARIRGMDPALRAASIASYEDGGLAKVFHAFLKARCWGDPALQAFRHFLHGHIRLDADPRQGHGALSRHLGPDDRIRSLWVAFKDLLVDSVPALTNLR